MRAIAALVCAVLLAGAVRASGEDLPPLPSRQNSYFKSREVLWASYTRSVLLKLFPTHRNLIRMTEVRISRSRGEFFPYSNGRELVVPIEFINFVRNEQEYATVLGHEFAHQLLLHRIAVIRPMGWAQVLGFEPEVDWPLYCRQESEADLLSIFVLGQTTTPLALMERAFKAYPAESRLGMEGKDIAPTKGSETFRLQAVRNIASLKSLRPIIPAHPLPRKLPSRSAPDEQWVACAKTLLTAMYPTYTDELARVEIDFVELGVVPQAEVFFFPNGRVLITLNREYVDAVIRKPEEFATLLGHEFAHIVLRRDLNDDYRNTGIEPMDGFYAQLETEADIFATLPLIRGACHFAKVLDRSVRHTPEGVLRHDAPNSDPADRVRANRLRAMCDLGH